MARKGIGIGIAFCASSLLVASFSGCAGHGAQLAEAPKVEMRQATRDQLLGMLEKQMSNIASLSCEANVSLYLQNIVVPATLPDDARRMSGREYRKKFLQVPVEGALLLLREPGTPRAVKFSGTVGRADNFLLLGKGDQFWILIPTSDEERERLALKGEAPPRARVLTGTVEGDALRSQKYLSIRPQDISDLLLPDEVFPALRGSGNCYMETWPEFYVINFLRPDWPERVYSKIWVERQGLTVAIHQLFDKEGEIVAEARFRDYAPFAGEGSKLVVDVPQHIQILWPRDKTVLDAKLGKVKVNGRIRPEFLDEKSLAKYPTEVIQPRELSR